MKTIFKRGWRYFVGEPLYWTFRVIFQYKSFEKETKSYKFSTRLQIMLRTVPLFFVLSYAFSLLILALFYQIFPELNPSPGSFPFGSIALGIGVGIALGIGVGIALGIGVGIVLGVGFGIALDIGFGIGFGIALSISEDSIPLSIVFDTGFGVGLAITGAIVFGITLGIALGIVLGIGRGIALGIALGIVLGIGRGIEFGIALGISSNFFYLIGYYRVPLYLVDGPSVGRAYLRSQDDPANVFKYLKRSALYWDERVFIPLPFLNRLLLIAADQNRDQALKEIAFIVSERPLQIGAARQAMLEIVLAEMGERENLKRINTASIWLGQYLPEESGVFNPRWQTALTKLNEASREASRYLNAQGQQTRRESLESFEQSLRQMRGSATFANNELSQRLAGVAEKWLAVAAEERKRLESEAVETGALRNPYVAGNPVSLRPQGQDNLFVGRRDVAQRIEDALSLGDQHPTLLMHGERRMGKTSALKQMPNLLGKRYLPVFFDLQSPSNRANLATFLTNLAEAIYEVLSKNGFSVKRIKLNEAENSNEALVYAAFDNWLKDVEVKLEKAGSTLLLTLDEFEVLEKYQDIMKLGLLLDWLRNMIQHRPRLALLFSGVKTFEEMSSDWVGYFVNVKKVKISFLREHEARDLITKPVPGFPGDEIYPEAVVDEIIGVTGCQPMLVQAVCSELINRLNETRRKRAELADLAPAIEETFEGWDYFIDLWRRTPQDEKTCLETLLKTGKLPLDYPAIAELTGLPANAVRPPIQRLLRRDLIVERDGSYCFAIPMLATWIERYAE